MKCTCLLDASKGSKIYCYQKDKWRIDPELVRNKLIFISVYWDQWLKTGGSLSEISAAEPRLSLHEERPPLWGELSEDLRTQQQNPCWVLWPLYCWQTAEKGKESGQPAEEEELARSTFSSIFKEEKCIRKFTHNSPCCNPVSATPSRKVLRSHVQSLDITLGG